MSPGKRVKVASRPQFRFVDTSDIYLVGPSWSVPPMFSGNKDALNIILPADNGTPSIVMNAVVMRRLFPHIQNAFVQVNSPRGVEFGAILAHVLGIIQNRRRSWQWTPYQYSVATQLEQAASQNMDVNYVMLYTALRVLTRDMYM